MTEDPQERRRHPRVPLALSIRVSSIDPETDPWTGRPFFRSSQEICGNLSRGGAFIRTREPFAAGRRLLLELELPDGRPVEAVGRVAWTRVVLRPAGADDDATGVGIEFLGGVPDDLARLAELAAGQPTAARSA
jgi:hypothetical protein